MKPGYLALVFAVLTAALHAEPSNQSAVAVGATQIQLAAPRGYLSPTGKAEVLWRTVENMMSTQKSRVIATYVNEADALALERNGESDFSRYFMVQAMRSTEDHSYSQAEFFSVKDSMRSHFNRTRSYTSAWVQEFLDSKAVEINKQLGADLISMKVGEQRLLEIFDESESSLSVLAVQRSSLVIGEHKDDTPKIMSISYVMLLDRVIFFFAYSPLHSGADIDWVRSETRKWIASNVAINARPNPSIERTSPGRPGDASHVNR